MWTTATVKSFMILGQVVSNPAETGNNEPIPGLDRLELLMHWVFVFSGVVAVVGIMAIGAKMAISHRGHGENPNIGALGMATAGCVIISIAAAVVNALLV
jgi:hypothetical protein